MKTSIQIIAVVLFMGVFFDVSLAIASVKPLPPGDYECQVDVVLLEDFNGEPNLQELFQKTFGGHNTLTVSRSQNGIRTGFLVNKNGADDLQILIMWNYMKDILTFVGASLVGSVQGYLSDCQ